MTHYREPGSVEDVLAGVLRALSADEVFAATGKRVGLFRQQSNPEHPCGLDFDDAAKLDAALEAKGLPGRFRPLFDALFRSALARAGGAVSRPVDLNVSLRRLSVETGQLAEAIDAGMSGGRLDLAGRRAIAREAQDVADHAIMIRDAVEPPDGALGVVAGGKR